MNPAAAALVAAIRSGLAAGGDPDRAVAQQRYMKSPLPYHGLTLPEVRRLTRQALTQHPLPPGAAGGEAWAAALTELWDGATHREEWYAALAIARHRPAAAWRDASRLPMWRHLIVTGAWWDVVDEVASKLVGPLLRSEPAVVRPALWAWATDDDLWLRRTSILASLGARDRTDTELLTYAIDANLEPRLTGTPLAREFFLRKAIGWALRDFAATDPEWVGLFVEAHREEMSGLSIREATKHLRSGATTD